MHETIYAPDYYILEHHGILGQKWGVRRYQNKDGSFTAAGKARYNKLTDKYTHTQDDTVAGAVIDLDRINRKYGYDNRSDRVQGKRRAAVDKNLKPGSREAYKLQKMDKKGGYTTPVMVTAKAYKYRQDRNTRIGATVGTMAGGVAGGVIGAAVGRISTEHLHPEDYKIYNDVIDSYIGTMADPKYRSRPHSAGNTGLNANMGGNNSTTTYAPLHGGKKHTTVTTVSSSVSTRHTPPPVYVDNTWLFHNEQY